MPKNFEVCSHKKMKKMHRSAFMRKGQKLSCLLSQKMPKNSHVREYEKIPKTRSSVVTEIAKNSQVSSHRKCQKLVCPWSRKMPKTRRSVVTKRCQKSARFAVIQKMHRSAFMQKSQKLAGPRSRKMPKTRRSAFTVNAKNSQVRGHGICQKVAGPRSR